MDEGVMRWTQNDNHIENTSKQAFLNTLWMLHAAFMIKESRSICFGLVRCHILSVCVCVSIIVYVVISAS